VIPASQDTPGRYAHSLPHRIPWSTRRTACSLS